MWYSINELRLELSSLSSHIVNFKLFISKSFYLFVNDGYLQKIYLLILTCCCKLSNSSQNPPLSPVNVVGPPLSFCNSATRKSIFPAFTRVALYGWLRWSTLPEVSTIGFFLKQLNCFYKFRNSKKLRFFFIFRY